MEAVVAGEERREVVPDPQCADQVDGIQAVGKWVINFIGCVDQVASDHGMPTRREPLTEGAVLLVPRAAALSSPVADEDPSGSVNGRTTRE